MMTECIGREDVQIFVTGFVQITRVTLEANERFTPLPQYSPWLRL